MLRGKGIAIAGGALLLIGTIFAFIKNKSQIVLNKCRSEVFKLICDGEDKLKYLENVETVENVYVGQIKQDDPHGFGVGVCPDASIYIGEWKSGSKSGIGKLITDDMLKVNMQNGFWKLCLISEHGLFATPFIREEELSDNGLRFQKNLEILF